MKTRPEISGNIEPYFWCIVSLEEEARGVASDGQATAKSLLGANIQQWAPINLAVGEKGARQKQT